MKHVNILLVLLIMVISAQTTQAQLFKKLKQSIEQKVENVIIEKTSDKAAEKTSNSLDKVFDINPFSMGKDK
ncbi:MAG: DUF4412 domain-containing protein, partial [Flavobacteriales bacterium]|nr:DUF4412 domain-containing protein [Flavobacteriales bacterium]